MKLDERLALSVKEAADAIGVSERHLRSMLPEIPHVYLHSRVVIPVDLLREWLGIRACSVELTLGEVADGVVDALESGPDREAR